MTIDIKIPPIGESITEVTLSAWLVNEGDYVKMDQSIAELESDKATLELPAEKAGTIQFLVSEGDDLEIGALVAKIDTSAVETSTNDASDDVKSVDNVAEIVESTKELNHPSPAARKILAEKDILPSAVKGTGRDARITKEDALSATKTEDQSTTNTQKNQDRSTPDVTSNSSRNQRREKMSRLRRTIAGHLVTAKNQTAMLSTFNEVDLTAIKEIRAKYKEQFKEKFEVGLGFMSFFTKACSMALIEFEAVNSQLDGDEIIYRDYVDISVAVSTPRGLVTPVVKDAHLMSMVEIEQEIKRLAILGRDNKLSLSDISGGTFTISNGGVFGSLLSTPIINIPQTAILGMHKIQDRAMVVNGEVTVLPMMYLALSYDHRIIDGKEAVTFLVRIKELLEDPVRMMINI